MSPASPSDLGHLRLLAVSRAIGDATRWRILQELALESPLPVGELALRTGRSPSMASRHVRVLRETGLVISKYSQLCHLAPEVRVDRVAGLIDLGPCLLKIDPLPPAPAAS